MHSRKIVSAPKRSKIIKLHLQGWTRDDIAKKTRVSAGAVSGIVKKFTERTDSASLDEAAQEYDVTETVESLRSLAVQIRKAGTNIEELMSLSHMRERVEKMVPLNKLEEFIKAGETLRDNAHVEASVRMYALETRAGTRHDDVLREFESKQAKINVLNSEAQSLQSQIKNLSSAVEKAQADFKAEKAMLEAEEKECLKQHGLTLERIERVSNVESGLGGYGISLTRVEELRQVLGAVEESGYDPRKLVEIAKRVDSLKAQELAETKRVTEKQEKAKKLWETVSAVEQKLKTAELVLEKGRQLGSMGWSRESLEKAMRLTKEAGGPEEALSRLELLKPSAEAKAELERTKAKTKALEEKASNMTEQILPNLQTLVNESSNLVNVRIPGVVAQINGMVRTQTIRLTGEYNSLAAKYGKLQTDYNTLMAQYHMRQNMLDDALSWSTLLQTPEKLPGDTIRRIFFDVMFPRLQAWCKGNAPNERLDIVKEMAKKTICLYTEPAANFMNRHEKASVSDAILALCSFAVVAMPFYEAFMTWYALHKNEADASKLFNAQYHLKQFYDEGVRKLSI